MSNLDSIWEKVNAQAIVGNVTEVFDNLKKELHTAWESEDWQIKVLMIQVATVAILLILIALAWKIHGPSIGKLLTTEGNILESKLKSRNCANVGSYSKQHLKKTE